MRARVLSALLLLICAAAATGQTRPELSLKLAPGASVPLGPNAAWFSFGGSAELSFGIDKLIPVVVPQLSMGYDYVPLRTTDAVHLVRAAAGAAVPVRLTDAIGLAPYLLGGYSYGVISDGSGQGGGAFVRGGLQLEYRLGPLFVLGADLSYRWDFGSWSGIGLSLGSGVRLPIGRQPAAPPPKLIKGLELAAADLKPVFPALSKIYATSAFGSITLRNLEKKPLADLTIDFFAASFMDDPTRVLRAVQLDGGAELTVPLTARFSELKIVSLTQSTEASARLTVTFSFDGQPYTREFTQTLGLYNRNNIVWDDTRKAAAFVTPNDPLVLALAKNAVAAAADLKTGQVDPKLSAAMSIHEALRAKGQRYSVDPKAPPDRLSKNAAALDTVSYPQESLVNGSGDCDDLTVLYCALLESVGAQTAFITTPGHIYAAVRLDLDASQAAGAFTRVQDLIVREKAVWLPVEVTMVGDRFLDAWRRGAEEWREHSSKGDAEFLPVDESWGVFEPVGQIPKVATEVRLPDRAVIAEAYGKELTSFIDQEIAPRVSALEKQIASRKTDPRPLNALGVLYAKYGRVDQAAAQFDKASKLGEYVPALINLGNLRFAGRDYKAALDFYQRAGKRDPKNAIVLLGLTRANTALGNDSAARAAYEALKSQAPEMAKQFAYLSEPASESARAANQDDVLRTMPWAEGGP
jgi:tetratricopeptide (TPR) repeat protein